MIESDEKTPDPERRQERAAQTADASRENAAAADTAAEVVAEAPDRQSLAVDVEMPPRLAFPVVGVGASAGGLEAITEFITAMPADSGMAFVFIQHLPPDRESLMADILARKTTMLVQQVEDGMEVKPDHVYVIRPGHVLTIKDGRFHLGAQLGSRAANRPVDDFLRSLAEEQRERSIAILMSGMGSNGTAGCQMIKAVGGLCIAQDPDTAQFPSMPRHLIQQGYADFILAPAHIPDILLQYANHPYARQDQKEKLETIRSSENQIREILAILRTRHKQDFGGYKKATILRRIQRRMGLTRIEHLHDYAKLLRQSPTEVTALADDLLIHVTGFFRDFEAWETLRQRVVVPLVAQREADGEIRAWVAACSSGEEAYTLAMVLIEEAERVRKPMGVRIFATDMAERSLGHARAGVYPGGIESEIPPERLERFFEKDDGMYRIKQVLRECVVFAPQNVLQDPPFSRLDIATCRNLLIYLEPPLQHRVLSLLHFGLREGGTLFLGTSETLGLAEEMFEPIDKTARIYRRVGATRHGMLDFPLPHAVRAGHDRTDAEKISGSLNTQLAALGERKATYIRPPVATVTQRALLEHHTGAAVTVNREHQVVYYHGNTRPFLDQPPGEPTRELVALARAGMRGAIRTALHQLSTPEGGTIVTSGWIEKDGNQRARVTVRGSAVNPSEFGPEYIILSFEEREEEPRPTAGAIDADAGAGSIAAAELRRIREELQSTIQELQTSNEELKASHEEATSMNEELQSSNEELETSKEEMQSLNEELTTVNAQLQAKMEEHQEARNDLTALLASTDIAVLFLDRSFRIRRYTPPVLELIDLIATDVGRPLADLNRKFEDPTLDKDVRAVLDKLVPVEREVSAANGRAYARRALPYRTVDNKIDGVVVTFVDVTERKRIERESDQARHYAEAIVETVHEPLLVLNTDLTVKSANEAFFEHFKAREAETVGKTIYALGNGQWDLPELRQALEDVLPANKVFEDYEVTHEFEGLGRRAMLLNGRRLDHVQLILLGIRDVTGERETAERIRRGETRLQRMMNIDGVGVLTFDEKSGTLLDANDSFLGMSGYTRDDVTSRRLTWRMLTPPEHVAESERQLAILRATGRLGPYEKEYVRKDGTRIWLLFAGASLGDGTLVEYSIDISERKRAELATHDREMRLAAMFGQAAVGLSEMGKGGHLLLVNDSLCAMLGRPRDALLATSVLDVTHPEDRGRCADLMARVFDGSDVETLEKRYVRGDGALIDATMTLTRLEHGDGRAPTILAVTVETTGRRRAERAVAESQEQFRLLVEGARDYAMIMQDPNGTIIAWNDGAQRLLGYGEREAIGQFGGIIFTEEDRAAGAPEKELRTAATQGRAEDERWHVRKNGTRFWGSGVQTPLRNADGSIRGFVKVMRDETQRKRAEEVLTQAKEAAEVSNRMKDEFLATLSHELRTPLSAIMIWTKLLRAESLAEAQRQEGLAAIEHSAQSQKQLIDDLFDSSRIVSGKLRLEMASVPIADLIRSTVDAITPTAEAKGVALTSDLSNDCGIVRADPERLRQIVWNLLTNAVKFTPAGGRIEVGLWRRNDDLEIRVADTGQGIEPAFLSRIFDRFSQADPSMSRTGGGLGLGLAIVKQLVELHGGTITAESPGPGAGATFRVLLPLRPLRTNRSATSARRSATSQPAAASVGGELDGIRILLVEDQPTSRIAFRTLLEAAGARVVDVGSAAEALRILPEEPPDLLLSDIGLPEMDGHAFIRQLRAAEAASDEPPLLAIALTAFARDEDKRAALDAGFNRYLSKPFTAEALVAAVRSLLDGR